MKFLCDNMVGKLARWLRILGYDTLYFRTENDEELIDVAKKEKRILLTRDTRLARRWIVPSLLIKSEKIEDQLEQVIKRFDLETEGKGLFSRCPICNTLLDEVEKEKVKDIVPELVYLTYRSFFFCKKCNKYYWEGTHWENIKGRLKTLSTTCPKSKIASP